MYPPIPGRVGWWGGGMVQSASGVPHPQRLLQAAQATETTPARPCPPLPRRPPTLPLHEPEARPRPWPATHPLQLRTVSVQQAGR